MYRQLGVPLKRRTTMDEDQLLRALGATAAEQNLEGQRSRWEAHLRGELSAEEAAESEREALLDPEVAVLLAAHRPLDAAVRERIASALASRLAASQGRPVGRVLEGPTRWRRRTAGAVTALALAAATALAVSKGTSIESLPSYALEVSGEQETRSGSRASEPRDAATCTLRAGDDGSFELLARPADRVGGAIAVQAFLVKGGEVTPWPGHLEVSPNGSVRVLDSSLALAGASELRLVIGRAGLVTATDAPAKAKGVANGGRGWQVLRCTVVSPQAP